MIDEGRKGAVEGCAREEAEGSRTRGPGKEEGTEGAVSESFP